MRKIPAGRVAVDHSHGSVATLERSWKAWGYGWLPFPGYQPRLDYLIDEYAAELMHASPSPKMAAGLLGFSMKLGLPVRGSDGDRPVGRWRIDFVRTRRIQGVAVFWRRRGIPSASSSGPERSIPLTDEVVRTFAFVDLSGFAALTETHGDQAAVDLVARFLSIARSQLRNGERLVKSIGDAVMLVAPDAEAGVLLVERIFGAASREPGFPALRAGIHHGPALERDRDWFGNSVNVAARVAAQASGEQILCTEVVAANATTVAAFRRLGSRSLRHLSTPVEIFEIVSPVRDAHREIDPVCRMVVDPGPHTPCLLHEGHTHWFCSLECLDRFVRTRRDSSEDEP